MRTFALAALAAVSSATVMTQLDYKFINYVATFGKSYGTVEEYNFRMQVFAEKDIEINTVND